MTTVQYQKSRDAQEAAKSPVLLDDPLFQVCHPSSA